MTFARATSLLIAALAAAGCTLTLNADDGNFCNAAGQCPGVLRCVQSKCIESGPICGDYEVDPGETCDLGVANVAACPEYGLATPTSGFCTTSCAPLSCPSTQYCGDGNVDSGYGEVCDLGPENGVCGQACSRGCAAWTCDREWCMWPPAALLLPDSNYDTTTAGIVRDTVTGLTWEQSPAATTYTWDDAGTHCAGLSLAGVAGWRLPTFIELLSILDYSKYNPAINTVAFPGTQPSFCWSSSNMGGPGSGYAWAVDFFQGYAFGHGKSAANFVRCVR
jgi:hypothetical protein